MTETLHGPTPGTDIRQIPVIVAVNSFHSSSENAASPVKPSRSRWIFRSRTLPPSIAVRRVAPSITVGERDAARKSSRCGQVSGSIRIVLRLSVNLGMKALRSACNTPQRRHHGAPVAQVHPQILAAYLRDKPRHLARLVKRAIYRIENSWIGDLIGGLSIIVTLIGGLLIGHAMSGGGL